MDQVVIDKVVREVVLEVCDLESQQYDPNQTWTAMGVDSLLQLCIVAKLEKKLKVVILDDYADKEGVFSSRSTPKELSDTLYRLLN